MNIAVLVNLRARRGSLRLAERVRQILPFSRLAVTRTVEDARRWIEDEIGPRPPGLLLAGGGDGTAIGVLNEYRRLGLKAPPIGVLPMGTGNAWARVTGAPKPENALRRIARLRGELPLRFFPVVETEGKVAHFAGTGWDAEIINDYQAQLASQLKPLKGVNTGLLGYLKGMFTRTIPRNLKQDGPVNVTLTNLGQPARTVNHAGEVIELAGGECNNILYQGPASVAAAATTTEWGFGFKAFPFAGQVPGAMSVRIYSAGAIEATMNMFKLWRGEHPMPKMNDFFLTHGRMDFDREVPFQIGGDLAGMRRSFEFRIGQEGVNLLDWNKLPVLH